MGTEALSITNCPNQCLTYETPDGEYDVAAYSTDCPVHGWRWNWQEMPEDERPQTLAACEERDELELQRFLRWTFGH